MEMEWMERIRESSEKKLKKRWVLQETRPDANVLCYRPPAEASDLNWISIEGSAL